MPVRRLNHAVLYVRDLARAVGFYRGTLGLEVRTEVPGRAAFLRAPDSVNDHDLGLFEIGDTPRTGPHGMAGSRTRSRRRAQHAAAAPGRLYGAAGCRTAEATPRRPRPPGRAAPPGPRRPRAGSTLDAALVRDSADVQHGRPARARCRRSGPASRRIPSSRPGRRAAPGARSSTCRRPRRWS